MKSLINAEPLTDTLRLLHLYHSCKIYNYNIMKNDVDYFMSSGLVEFDNMFSFIGLKEFKDNLFVCDYIKTDDNITFSIKLKSVEESKMFVCKTDEEGFFILKEYLLENINVYNFLSNIGHIYNNMTPGDINDSLISPMII